MRTQFCLALVIVLAFGGALACRKAEEKAPATWHWGAIFGHLAPTKSAVKKPGEWSPYTITCAGKRITVDLNGEKVTDMDMSLWTSAETNPDGSEIPAWLSRPKAELAAKGRIGFQGKHAGAPICFRNIGIRKINWPELFTNRGGPQLRGPSQDGAGSVRPEAKSAK
jgi:hypothetical protein